jgi:hypothetical protein
MRRALEDLDGLAIHLPGNRIETILIEHDWRVKPFVMGRSITQQ